MSKVIKNVKGRKTGHIVKHENGKLYYIDSANTIDRGFETMVFKCERKESPYGIDWLDIHAEWHSTREEMENYHYWLIEHLEEVGLYNEEI